MNESYEFPSMGCDVVVAGARPSERKAIERLFSERERIFSRFIPDSELSRVNASAGTPVQVTPLFAAMLGLALDAARETGGLVDPTFGVELEAAGYDSDFSLLEHDPRPPSTMEPRPSDAVRLAGRSLLVPKGVRLDLNGVVKGRTVDDALALLRGRGFVSAGGDLAVRGTFVAALPRGGTISLVRGGLATSGTDRRRWWRGGRLQHHLIDPSTRVPASSPWEQVTTCGVSCVSADIAAKAAFLLGTSGPAWLDERGMPGRFVTPMGDVVVNRAWQRSLEPAACI